MSETAGARTVLALGNATGELDELTRDLRGRRDLLLVHCPDLDDIREALRRVAVELLIVCAGVPARKVAEALRAVADLRPGIPVLVVRQARTTLPAAWHTQGVGVLRTPLLPHALSRSVDVVLGLEKERG